MLLGEQDIVNQLTEFYLKYDQFQEPRISEPAVRHTLEVLRRKHRLLIQRDMEGSVLGYVEGWRITFEQLGRLVCHVRPFDVALENIETGPIFYVANVTIHPDYRHSDVVLALRYQVFARNADAQYFVGEALRKPTQPWKVFTAAKLQPLISRWATTRSEVMAYG